MIQTKIGSQLNKLPKSEALEIIAEVGGSNFTPIRNANVNLDAESVWWICELWSSNRAGYALIKLKIKINFGTTDDEDTTYEVPGELLFMNGGWIVIRIVIFLTLLSPR